MKDKKKVKINVPQDKVEAQYSDFAIISKHALGFNIDFGQRVPGSDSVRIVGRIGMSPQHAKLLLRVLGKNIADYEKKFGEISMPKAPKMESKDGNMIHFVK